MSWTDADEDEFQGPVRMIPMDLVYIGVGFMGRIADAVSETLEGLRVLWESTTDPVQQALITAKASTLS